MQMFVGGLNCVITSLGTGYIFLYFSKTWRPSGFSNKCDSPGELNLIPYNKIYLI